MVLDSLDSNKIRSQSSPVFQRPSSYMTLAVCGTFKHISHDVRKPTMWFLNKSDTNETVQAQKMYKEAGNFRLSRRAIVPSE